MIDDFHRLCCLPSYWSDVRCLRCTPISLPTPISSWESRTAKQPRIEWWPSSDGTSHPFTQEENHPSPRSLTIPSLEKHSGSTLICLQGDQKRWHETQIKYSASFVRINLHSVKISMIVEIFHTTLKFVKWLTILIKDVIHCFFLHSWPQTKCRVTFDTCFWHSFLCSFTWHPRFCSPWHLL